MKINKEIQRYQESILFGLSLRQMVFALLAIGVAVGAYFGSEAAHRRGGGRLGVHAGSVPVCHVRLFYLQRHARRALPAGGHPLGDPLPANAVVSSAESVCGIAAGLQFHAGGADA